MTRTFDNEESALKFVGKRKVSFKRGAFFCGATVPEVAVGAIEEFPASVADKVKPKASKRSNRKG